MFRVLTTRYWSTSQVTTLLTLAYRLAGSRKRQQTVVGANARDGNFRAILLADERLGKKHPLLWTTMPLARYVPPGDTSKL